MALALLTDPLHAETAGTQGMSVEWAQLIERDDRNIISADIHYHFPDVVLRALEEGIPLTFRIEFRILRLRTMLWSETLLQDERTIQLRYQPLAKSYQISDLGSGAVVHYANLVNVLDTLSHLRGWSVPAPPEANTDEKRIASLKLYFDVEALPLPLRLQAYLSPQWKMDTPSYRWPLAH